jgi:WD40 repeat protein
LFRGDFSLIIINCNYRNLAQKLLSILTAQTGKQYRQIRSGDCYESFWGQLQNEYTNASQLGNPSALICLAIGETQSQKLENLFTEINLLRDRLKREIRVPLVLWLNDSELQQFWINAPELANLAAPPIVFGVTPAELEHDIREQVNRLLAVAEDPQIPLFWQDLKIDADQQSFSYAELELARRELKNAESLSNLEVLLELEAKLDFALGRLWWRSPESTDHETNSISQTYYEASLDYWQKADRPIESGILLFYLGNLWWHNSFVDGIQAGATWMKAKFFFSQAIAAFKKSDRLDLIAKYGRAYSDVLEKLHQWQELEKWLKYLLPLHQNVPLELAQDYGYLTKIAIQIEQWQQVKEYAGKALSIIKLAPVFAEKDLTSEYQHLHDLQVYQHQIFLTRSHLELNELELAVHVIEPAIAAFNHNYEPSLYIQMLDIFHDVTFAQGQYLRAFQLQQKQRSIEQQYGLRAFIGAVVLQSKPRSPNVVNSGMKVNKFDLNLGAIAASGRTQDVEHLVKKVLAVDRQITVIHGESGVGKSSLVNAGLIPTLLQRSTTSKKILPIKIHVYANWMKPIALAIDRTIDILIDPNLNNNNIESDNIEGDHSGDRQVSNILGQLKQLAANGTQIILIFDQFEEFFSTYSQPQERQIFIDFWQKCLAIPSLKLVLSLREDYLYLLLELESSLHHEVDILSRELRYEIGNLSIADTKYLIANLTEHTNFKLEPSLLDQLVQDLAGDRGTVRPIELQLVGSQLQDRHITSLSAYYALGGKQRLVEQSVQEVIVACGDEAALTAKKVLFLLTDEQGKRPLRTYNELRTAVLAYANDTENLDLVLEILVGSGLIFQFPERSNNRYQLVHDYLVSFIRATQEPDLLAELIKAESSAKRSQSHLNRLTKLALFGSVAAVLILTGFAFQANRDRQIAEFGEIEALVSSSSSSFLLNRELESLAIAIQAAQKLKMSNEINSRIKQSTFENMQAIIYNIRERYRFYSTQKDTPFYAAKFSPDGKLFALSSFNGGVDLYQNNGVLISSLVGFQTSQIRGLSFSPDSKRIASTGKGKSVRIWDVSSGKLISKFYAHDDDIFRVSFHPDGKRLLTGSKDGKVKLWDSDRGLLLVTINPESPISEIESTNKSTTKNTTKNNPNQKIEPIQDASFSPDGNLIVTAKNTAIALWNLDGSFITSAIAHDREIYNVKFQPDGKGLLTSARDGTVKLWQISNQDPQIKLVKIFKTTLSDALSLTFNAAGDRLAIAYQDNSIQILNTEGTLEMKLAGHTDSIFDLNFSPDGRYLLSASKDRTARLWDLQATLLHTLYGHTSNVWAVSFNPNGKMFASGSVDQTIRLWNADGTFRQELKGHENTVYGVSFSKDGTKIVSASADKTVQIWDAETGKRLHRLNIHNAPLIYAAFSPDQTRLATLGWDGQIKIWNWHQGSPQLLHVLSGHRGIVWAIAFSPDGKSLVSTGNDQTVKVWDLNNGQNIHTVEAHLDGGLAIAYSPDGQQIASAGKDGKLKLWNAQTMVLERDVTITANFWIYGITFSPDGQAIATANSDKTIKIIDPANGQLLKTLSGHTAEAFVVSYSPDGKTLISGSRDNTVKIWNAETLNFDQLVERGCNLLNNYLQSTDTIPPEQKNICTIKPTPFPAKK